MTEDLTDDALDLWRGHPVTRAIEMALRAQTARQRRAAEAAYWRGAAWPEDQRLSLLRMEALVEDIFESSAADLNEAMRKDDDERERDQPR